MNAEDILRATSGGGGDKRRDTAASEPIEGLVREPAGCIAADRAGEGAVSP